jgi:hypothetical protein
MDHEKFSFYLVRLDHQTGYIEPAGDLLEGLVGGCMYVVKEEGTTEGEWRYPKTDEEILTDAMGERKLQIALDGIIPETLTMYQNRLTKTAL